MSHYCGSLITHLAIGSIVAEMRFLFSPENFCLFSNISWSQGISYFRSLQFISSIFDTWSQEPKQFQFMRYQPKHERLISRASNGIFQKIFPFYLPRRVGPSIQCCRSMPVSGWKRGIYRFPGFLTTEFVHFSEFGNEAENRISLAPFSYEQVPKVKTPAQALLIYPREAF